MKINNKYSYSETYKKPNRVDFPINTDFKLAEMTYKFNTGHLGQFTNMVAYGEAELKTYKRRRLRREIKVGSTVFIERWDGNGIDSEVIVTKIIPEIEGVKIITDKGYFLFTGKKDMEFTWTKRNTAWERKYKKWINGELYYYKD